MKYKRGMLIDFEGIDGSGKWTQTKLLEKELKERGFDVAIYSYPNYNSEYGKIIEGFLDGKFDLNIDEQFLLYLTDILRDKKRIKEKLKKGSIVITDRYFPSTIAYQCANLFDFETAKKIVRLVDLTVPSVIFYLDIPADVAFFRKRKEKGMGDRFEEDISFLGKVRKIYERLIEEEFPISGWIRLDGREKAGDVYKQILLE